MRRRRKILLAIAAVLGSLLLAAGVAPYVIDVEAYRPVIIEAVRDATGRELLIEGPVRLRLFPVPGVGAGQVRFANAVGALAALLILGAFLLRGGRRAALSATTGSVLRLPNP